MNKDIFKIGVMTYFILCFVGLSAAQNIPAIEMIFVKGGTFTMGCTAEQESDCWPNEYPPHSVTVSDFYIGKYEVTQKLWEAVMDSNPSSYKGDNLPVESVSWNDAQEFISKLNSITGLNYRLPTEAEWEYAARGGQESRGYRYSGSNNIDDVAWWARSGGETRPVGLKQPNELGIYDMSGNVGEWVDGWFVPYTPEAKINPTGSLTEVDSMRQISECSRCFPNDWAYRVSRGGSWIQGGRISFRYTATPPCGLDWFKSEEERQAAIDALPNWRSDTVGFRLALTVEQK
ncbi:MAG: formylglycine-generating enzyme family protein [Chitinispirillales bacterium]|jgi:formylglycine-generating enzyme required for sulfatase activity|nr:formylglycine-generating enzyme family protein [Chitinispirillales bacterium]